MPRSESAGWATPGSIREYLLVYPTPLIVFFVYNVLQGHYGVVYTGLWAAILLPTEGIDGTIYLVGCVAAIPAYALRPRQWTGVLSFLGTLGWYVGGTAHALVMQLDPMS